MTMSSLSCVPSMHLASLCIRSLTTPRRCWPPRCLLIRGQAWQGRLASPASPAPSDLEESRPHCPPPSPTHPQGAAPSSTTCPQRTSPKACCLASRNRHRQDPRQHQPLSPPHKYRPFRQRLPLPATSSLSSSTRGSSPHHTYPLPPSALHRSAQSPACLRPTLRRTRPLPLSPQNHPRLHPGEAHRPFCPSRGVPPHWLSASSKSLRSSTRCTWMMVSGTLNWIASIRGYC